MCCQRTTLAPPYQGDRVAVALGRSIWGLFTYGASFVGDDAERMLAPAKVTEDLGLRSSLGFRQPGVTER